MKKVMEAKTPKGIGIGRGKEVLVLVFEKGKLVLSRDTLWVVV